MSIEDLRTRYLSLFGAESAATDAPDLIEKYLQIALPRDFKEIAKFYSGGVLGGISHYAIANGGTADNVVDETLRIRKTTRLPMSLIVIAEPPESIIVLNGNTGKGAPAVIWSDAIDVNRLSDFNSVRTPQTWQCYGDFFSFLLNREEQRRRRNGERTH